MKRSSYLVLISFAVLLLAPSIVQAEILAMLNYKSKLDNTIRKEGIIVMDVDPNSSTYGQTLMDIPLPHDLVAPCCSRCGPPAAYACIMPVVAVACSHLQIASGWKRASERSYQ